MEQSKFALDRVLYNHAEIMLCNWTFESAAKLWEKIMKYISISKYMNLFYFEFTE